MKCRTVFPIVAALAVAGLFLPAVAEDMAGQPATSSTHEGPVTLTSRIDKSLARVADPIQLTLEVVAPPKTKVELPEPPKQLGDFAVRASGRFNDVPSGDRAGKRLWILKMTLDSLKTGALTIPPLDIRLATAGESSGFQTLHTKPLPVQIASVLENRADPTQFRDIKPAVDVAVPEAHSYIWLGGTAAGLATVVAGGLLIAIRRQRRRGPSAAEWARAALQELAAKNLATRAGAEFVITEVVHIAREFCELEFGIPAGSQTSREFVAAATQHARLPQPAHDSLAGLVAVADGVKFARWGVSCGQARAALERAKSFVNECERQSQSLGQESG